MPDQPPDDRTAKFAATVLAHVPRLRRYATAWLHSAVDADDLVQDCLERAIRRQDTLRDPERIGNWLLAILHNLHRNERRSRGRRGEPIGIDSLAEDLALAAPAEDRDQIRDFVRAMDTLSKDHRQILVLVGLEGLTYRETAEALDVPIGTVMSRLARAREQLRIALEGGDRQEVRRVR